MSGDEDGGEFFPVLGTGRFAGTEKILLPAPKWIREAERVSGRLDSDQTQLGSEPWEAALSERLRERLRAGGVLWWFPVQRAVVPLLLGQALRPPPLPPRDLCVSAPTGSGKTLAYALPIVAALERRRLVPATRALILLPQSDLAAQVAAVFRHYAEGSQLRTELLGPQRERRLLGKEPPDIVVATPGRLVDHLVHSQAQPPEKQSLRLAQLRYLVIDEADRLMAEGRWEWLEAVEAAVFGPKGSEGPRRRVGAPTWANLKRGNPPLQKLLFSATLSQAPEVLARWGLFFPLLFAANAAGDRKEEMEEATGEGEAASVLNPSLFSFPPALRQEWAAVELKRKPLIVHKLLKDHTEWSRVLCFAGSREKARRLRLLLQGLGFPPAQLAEISGMVGRTKRQRLLRRLEAGRLRLLIASDIAARGIDVKHLSAVLNYDPPRTSQAYAHRVGRTARAGQEGIAITLLGKGDEAGAFETMMKEAGWWSSLEKRKLAKPSSEEESAYAEAMAALKAEISKAKPRRRTRN